MELEVACQRYWYNPGDGICNGKIVDTNTEIGVVANPQLEGYKFGLGLFHKNYLSCRLINLPKQHIIYYKKGCPLSEYVTTLGSKQRKIFSVMYCPSDGTNGDRLRLPYVHSKYRSLLRGIIDFLVFLHNKKEMSLFDFSIKDFVVIKEELKFAGVRFRRATNATKRNDFICASRVINDLFDKNNPVTNPNKDSIPYDIEQLLKLMNDYPRDGHKTFLAKYETLLSNHLSILTPNEVLSFIKNCVDKYYEMRVNERVKSGYGRAIRGLLSPNWRSKFTGDCYRAIFDSYNNRPEDAKEYIDKLSAPQASDREVNVSMLHCCRNMATHLGQEIRKLDDPKPFDDSVIENMLMSVFRVELLQFQANLHREGVLSFFMGLPL